MKIKIISKKNYPKLKKLYSKFDISEDAEVCLAVGGDGTFIKAANEFDGPILPVRSDSTFTAYICRLALGKENVFGVVMPSDSNPKEDENDAKECAQEHAAARSTCKDILIRGSINRNENKDNFKEELP